MNSVRRSMDEDPANCPDCGLPFDECVCANYIKHVEDDSHYLEDYDASQAKFKEIEQKYNNLVRYVNEILVNQGHYVIHKEPKEFLIKYPEE